MVSSKHASPTGQSTSVQAVRGTALSHSLPKCDGPHSHANPFAFPKHVPPFLQGPDAQNPTGVSHVTPVKPSGHVHAPAGEKSHSASLPAVHGRRTPTASGQRVHAEHVASAVVLPRVRRYSNPDTHVLHGWHTEFTSPSQLPAAMNVPNAQGSQGVQSPVGER